MNLKNIQNLKNMKFVPTIPFKSHCVSNILRTISSISVMKRKYILSPCSAINLFFSTEKSITKINKVQKFQGNQGIFHGTRDQKGPSQNHKSFTLHWNTLKSGLRNTFILSLCYQQVVIFKNNLQGFIIISFVLVEIVVLLLFLSQKKLVAHPKVSVLKTNIAKFAIVNVSDKNETIFSVLENR